MDNINPSYQWILDEYPEIITKEQLYKICHVSKKTALHYLENGLIPCTSTGMKTRKFKIRTIDVVLFLQKRDQDADACLAPRGWYKGLYKGFPKVFTPAMQKKTREALELGRLRFRLHFASNEWTNARFFGMALLHTHLASPSEVGSISNGNRFRFSSLITGENVYS